MIKATAKSHGALPPPGSHKSTPSNRIFVVPFKKKQKKKQKRPGLAGQAGKPPRSPLAAHLLQPGTFKGPRCTLHYRNEAVSPGNKATSHTHTSGMPV